jgi:hypothetical protein
MWIVRHSDEWARFEKDAELRKLGRANLSLNVWLESFDVATVVELHETVHGNQHPEIVTTMGKMAQKKCH